MRPARSLALLVLLGALLVAGCGTTYRLAEIDPATAGRAAAMFESSASDRARTPAAPAAALARFERVAARVRPVAEALCRGEMADGANASCAVEIGIDAGMVEPNAYFTYADAGRREPRIMVTPALLADVRNDDELAFVLGHEYGHLIGRHIQKQEQQAVVGGLLLGALAGAAMQGAPDSQKVIEDSVNLGMAVGGRAYGQTYELESDTLGTLIARGAGYDPVRGAAYFAQPARAGSAGGRLSFWGTHPPDELRLATVMATAAEIERQGGIRRAAAR